MLTDRACGASYSAYCLRGLRVTGSDAIVRISDQAVNRQGPSSSLSTPTTSRHSSLTTRTHAHTRHPDPRSTDRHCDTLTRWRPKNSSTNSKP